MGSYTHARMCTLGWGRCVRRKPLLEQLAACVLTFPATAESDQELKDRERKPRAPAAGTAASLHSAARSARARACSPLPLVAGLAFQSGARTPFGGARRSRDAGRPSAGPHSRAAAVTYPLSTHRHHRLPWERVAALHPPCTFISISAGTRLLAVIVRLAGPEGQAGPGGPRSSDGSHVG